ncbi:MAG: TIGR00159 family protein [Chloroflexi bacterium]|nr:TIGR00159 family protein [Chloroflexota bacterium]
MNTIPWDSLFAFPDTLNWLDVVDILLVTAVIYMVFALIRGTRAVQVLRGFVVLALIIFILSRFIALPAFSWLVSSVLPTLLLSIPIIFQPELRRALEQIGRTGSWIRIFRRTEVSPLVIAVKEASLRLSQRRHGALIVFERDTGLQEYIDTGIFMNSESSPELFLTIFNKHTELHDGAVIIRDEKIAAAACVMPLSTSSLTDRQMGLRHRAALGISEVSDAVAVVVSEETGQVSIAHNGRIIRRQDPSRLDDILQAFLHNRGKQTDIGSSRS